MFLVDILIVCCLEHWRYSFLLGQPFYLFIYFINMIRYHQSTQRDIEGGGEDHF